MPSNFADFDDLSCEMIFGQEPPAITEDPAFKQPCYKLCNNSTHPFTSTYACTHMLMHPNLFHLYFKDPHTRSRSPHLAAYRAQVLHVPKGELKK